MAFQFLGNSEHNRANSNAFLLAVSSAWALRPVLLLQLLLVQTLLSVLWPSYLKFQGKGQSLQQWVAALIAIILSAA